MRRSTVRRYEAVQRQCQMLVDDLGSDTFPSMNLSRNDLRQAPARESFLSAFPSEADFIETREPGCKSAAKEDDDDPSLGLE